MQVLSRMNCSCASLFSEYFEGKSFQLYCLLKGPDYKETGYEERRKRKQQSINHYALNCDLQMFKKLIDVCSSISGIDNHSSWEVGEGLGIAFDAISDKADWYVDAIKYYIKNDTPNNLYPYHLVDTLFSLLSDSEVYEIIISEEYSQKNAWIYAYYHELPLELITEKHLQELYDFLKDTSDRYITSSSMRDVDFLEKYNVIDELALIEGCKIILDKKEYSSFIVDIYFGLLFNYHHNTPKEVIQKFNCNLELLEEIYYAMLSYDKHHDYDGQFLKEIYLVRPSILDKYIDYLINIDSFSDHQEKHCCFFDLDDFVEIYNKIFEQLIRNRRYSKLSVPYFLESLLLPKQNEKKLLERQDMWIRQCIQRFCNDKAKMYCLFSVVSKLEFKRKKEYILLFLENNPLFEDFEKSGNYKLDGKYFRKDTVKIINSVGKSIHIGIDGEEAIEKNMEDLIQFMNRKDIPFLVKASISHFFFEYIHPFYDGNGRFGRYLLSSYLARKLDILTAFSLSYSISKNLDDYYKSFVEVEDVNNYGEITFFVENILKTIKNGQEMIIELLNDSIIRFNHSMEILNEISKNLSEKENIMLQIYLQNYLFNDYGEITNIELTDIIGGSTQQTINKYTEELEKKGYLIKIKQRPLTYTLSNKITDKI